MDAQMRVWSDKWATKFKVDPEEFFRRVTKLDIERMSIDDVAKELDIPHKRASYLQRGYKRFGKPRRRADRTMGVVTPIRAIDRMYIDYQNILQREADLEAELVEIRKKKDKYKGLGVAFKNLQEAAARVASEEKLAVVGGSRN